MTADIEAEISFGPYLVLRRPQDTTCSPHGLEALHCHVRLVRTGELGSNAAPTPVRPYIPDRDSLGASVEQTFQFGFMVSENNQGIHLKKNAVWL